MRLLLPTLLLASGVDAFSVSASGMLPAWRARRALPRRTFHGLRGGGSTTKCSVSAMPENDAMLSSVLKVAEAAAREAGDLIKLKTGADCVKTKVSSKDLLTEIDPMCQSIIERHVREAFPDHSFLGEESVAPGALASADALTAALSGTEWLWIVDPIDGTTNFVHSIPFSVVSIGIARRGEVVGGVIMDPFRDELFSSVVGHGAFLNGEPITCGQEAVLEEAVICAGSPPNAASIAPSLRGVNALMPSCRTIRMFGSAALHLAWIACGRVTAYFEPDLNSWDVAAGALLVREAGGEISGLDGSEFSLATRAVLASNGKTHQSILKTLQEANVYGLDDV